MLHSCKVMAGWLRILRSRYSKTLGYWSKGEVWGCHWLQIANFMSRCQCSLALNLYDKYSSEVLASLKSSLNPFLILIKKCQVQVQNTNRKYFFTSWIWCSCSDFMFFCNVSVSAFVATICVNHSSSSTISRQESLIVLWTTNLLSVAFIIFLLSQCRHHPQAVLVYCLPTRGLCVKYFSQ